MNRQTIKNNNTRGYWLALALASLVAALIVIAASVQEVQAAAEGDLMLHQSQQQSGDYNNLGKCRCANDKPD